MADGYAVKELLKIASLLYQAAVSTVKADSEMTLAPPFDISSKLSHIKLCRALASDITEKGSRLYELLGKEMNLRVFFLIR